MAVNCLNFNVLSVSYKSAKQLFNDKFHTFELEIAVLLILPISLSSL